MISIDNQANARLGAPFVDALLELINRPGVTAAVGPSLHDAMRVASQIDPGEPVHQSVDECTVIRSLDEQRVDPGVDLPRHQRASSSISTYSAIRSAVNRIEVGRPASSR